MCIHPSNPPETMGKDAYSVTWKITMINSMHVQVIAVAPCYFLIGEILVRYLRQLLLKGVTLAEQSQEMINWTLRSFKKLQATINSFPQYQFYSAYIQLWTGYWSFKVQRCTTSVNTRIDHPQHFSTGCDLNHNVKSHGHTCIPIYNILGF